MRFALINDQRTEAEPGLSGLCPGCVQPVVAKCGTQRIPHWAHRTDKKCNSWWESETEWHREWKNNFPVEWQEIILPDEQSGEKHIADVRTINGLVIEFQHSHINPQERTSRENFHRNMVWIVNGMRLKRDYQRFFQAKTYFYKVNHILFRVSNVTECFPLTWLKSCVPVIFDFRSEVPIENLNDNKHHLYCLIPVRLGPNAILAEIPRKTFIDMANTGQWSLWIHNLVKDILQVNKERQDQIAIQQQRQNNINFNRATAALRNRKNRRF